MGRASLLCALCASVTVGLGLLGCGQPPAQPPSLNAPVAAATPEEAAVEFLSTSQGFRGREPSLDRQATLRLWRQRVEHKATEGYSWSGPAYWRGDLNGDGLLDYVWDIGVYVQADGTPTNENGATGNRAWVLLVAGPAGGYVRVLDGYGTPPHLYTQTHHGWRDLETGSHLGGSERAVNYQQFGGRAYRGVWSGTGSNAEYQMTMTPCDFPEDLVRRIVTGRLGGAENSNIVPVKGWCYRGDLDSDANAECLIWLDEVRVDGRAVNLGEGGQANLFLFSARPGGWELLLSANHDGFIDLPWQMSPSRYQLRVRPKPVPPSGEAEKVIYTIDDGQLVPDSSVPTAD